MNIYMDITICLLSRPGTLWYTEAMNGFLRWFLILLGGALCADTAFFLPRTNGNLGIWLPALLGIPLLLLGIFAGPLCAWFARGGWGRIVKWAILCGYCLCALFFGCMSLFLYARGHERAQNGADAVLVLGCGLYDSRVSLTLRYRLDTALAYLQRNPDAVCFVSGGQGYGESVSEAEAMRDYLLAHGLHAARIVMETASVSTQENFALSYPLIAARCGAEAKIVYVTTDFHVYRAGRIAAKQGIAATGQGAPGVWYLRLNDYMRESVAVAAYWALGRI